MTKAQLAFIEREFKDADRWNLLALLQRIVVLDGGKEADRIEGEEISSKMLSLIDEMEKNSNLLDVILPVSVNKEIGRFNSEVGTKQCLEKAKYYLEKARDIFKTSEDVRYHGRSIQLRAKLPQLKRGSAATVVQRRRKAI